VDDNARALIVVAQNWRLFKDEAVLPLFQTYLSFMHYAFNEENERFRNFMTYDRKWLEEQGSEDSHGRAIWGLGMAVSYFDDPGMLSIAVILFHKALKVIDSFHSPRSLSFALIGIHAYLARFSGDSQVKRHRQVIALKLFKAFQANWADDWPWLEDVLTYANGKLVHALILSGQWMYHKEMLEKGLAALEWLTELQLSEGYFVPIGNKNWFIRGETKARFDQQPLEAYSMIEACVEAFNVTRDKKWIERAIACFNWFLGDNDLHASLYNSHTGGCGDCLVPDGVNQNKGAESTLSWLLSLTTLHKLAAENSIVVNQYQKEMI